MTITGKYNTASVYATVIEEEAKNQIKTLLDQPFVEGEKIAIMPDVHAGAGCTIGYTQTLNNNKVCPNLVGVDIACGMLTVKLGAMDIDLPRFDEIVHKFIPAGMSVHNKPMMDIEFFDQLICYSELKNVDRLACSAGTLGGGNHFIELDKDEYGNVYLVIHSGSRNLGKQVAEIYQKKAIEYCSGEKSYQDTKTRLIDLYKKLGREKHLEEAINKLNEMTAKDRAIPDALAYLSDNDFGMYIHDVMICTGFANFNRKCMANRILKTYLNTREDFPLELSEFYHFTTLHNYIGDDWILRKGAISAEEGETVLIPINMRDGSLICRGKGNPDYNYSAPHGAGRLMSRKKAKESVSMDAFKSSMEGIYSTSVCESTLDESPFAYKSIDDILPMLEPTVEVIHRLRPIYNFKATK